MVLKICILLTAAVTAYGQMPGYGGPGVSSRGSRQIGNRGTEPVSIRPYATVLGIADSGLTPVILTQEGSISNPGTLYGVEANVGAYGSKSWKRNQLGLDYQGSYRHYNSKTYYNGSDHLMGLDYASQLSRRVGFRLYTIAGTTSRTTSGILNSTLFDPNIVGTSFHDIFDNRAYFIDISGDMLVQLGPRSAVAVGASGFAVRRQSKALVGLNGQRAFGSFSRQISRRSTVSLAYTYMHVDYPRVFGEADVNTLMLQLRRSFRRRWSFSVGVGAFRTDFAGVRTVTVDPVVAELFGVTTGREAFNSIGLTSAISAGLTRSFRRGSFDLMYSRGANPGNGALLLNRSELFAASYSYNTGNKWYLSTTLGYGRYSGYGIYNDRQSTYQWGFMANRQLNRDFYFTAGFDVRRYGVNQNSFRRVTTRALVGITYSPGEIPVAMR